MHPNSNNLDRLLRRILKGQEVPVEELYFHWRGLGRQADRLLINQLNRLEAWDRFLRWIASQPGAGTMLAPLSERAGVPEKAVEAIRRMGIQIKEADSQRSAALWIQRVVREEQKESWDEARSLLQQDADLLEGILPMLEALQNVSAADFLSSLLKVGVTADQDHLIRKSLYHLKQKGIVPPEAPGKQLPDKDFLFLGENRIALWQPVFLFRYASSFSDACDLYTIRIMEGRDASSLNQQRGLRIGREGLEKLVQDYSEHLKKDIGVYIPFRPAALSHGRYFLQKSLGFQRNEESRSGLNDFLQLIGVEPSEDPWIHSPKDIPEGSILAEQESILDSPYFASWAFYAADFKEYLSEMDKLREGPIILTEHQVHEMSHSAAVEALRKYMDGPARRYWAFAFEKAAFFLKDSDQHNANRARKLWLALEDTSLAVDRIPVMAVLLDRMTAVLQQEKQARKDEEKKESVILSPQEFARRYQSR